MNFRNRRLVHTCPAVRKFEVQRYVVGSLIYIDIKSGEFRFCEFFAVGTEIVIEEAYPDITHCIFHITGFCVGMIRIKSLDREIIFFTLIDGNLVFIPVIVRQKHGVTKTVTGVVVDTAASE